MDVLLVGGTGFIGTALAELLVERGHEVTALSRTPAEETLPEGVETATGDVTAFDSIVGSFEGRDAAVNLVALSPLFEPSGELSHGSVHLGGTENVVQACEDNDVPRLVQLSALGADPNGNTAYIRSKGRAETVVRESDLDWTIFRPSVVFGDGGEFLEFTKQLTPGPVKALPGGGRTRFQPIWVGDLVSMLADAVEDDQHSEQTYEVGGPEVLTLAEITKLVYAAEGKSVTIASVPMPLVKLGLTAADSLPFIPIGADQARSLSMDNTLAENECTAFGLDPEALTTLRSYLGVDS
jgi:NADH dehydrogenase